MLKNIFKPTKKKILSSVGLAVLMSIVGPAVVAYYPSDTSLLPIIIFGVFYAGYLLLQLIIFLILGKIFLPGSLSALIILTLLPFIGQIPYAYLLVSIYKLFKDRRNAKIEISNSPLTNDINPSNILPGMHVQPHAFSLTKEMAQMKVLRSPGFLIIVVILVITLCSTWLYAEKSSNLFFVWTPSQVVEFALPDTTHMITIKFRSAKNFNDKSFVLSPSLRGIVSFNVKEFDNEREGFKNIHKDRDDKITLTFKAPNTVNTKYTGTLHLRNRFGQADSIPALPITFIVYDQRVPSDPGEAGKQTLEGIDSDNDGVRDDLQRWIVLNYLDSEKRRAALVQYVKTNQAFLLDADDKQLSRTHAMERERAANCADYVFITLDAVRKAILEMKAEFLNTEERSLAFIRADAQLSGYSGIPSYYGQDLKAFCIFDPDLMAN